MTILSTKLVKLSEFAKRYFRDPESRPTTVTLKNHIQKGLLSGRKIGGQWFVECTDWDQPIRYSSQANQPPILAPSTGNALADKILAELVK